MLAGLLVLLLLAGSGYLALGTSVLAVRTVEVTGSREVPKAAVVAAADVPVGTPLARLDRSAIRARVVAALPAVATVSVERAWPSTMRLVVVERVPAAAVPYAGRHVLVDRTGVAYRTVGTVPAGLPILQVRRPGPADPATRAALTVLTGLPPDLRRRLQRIEAPTAEQVALLLRDGRRVVWGDASDPATKAAVVRVLLGRPGRVIDVSSPGLATVR